MGPIHAAQLLAVTLPDVADRPGTCRWPANGCTLGVMTEAEGARAFRVAGAAYDGFMGRYSIPLAEQFADGAGVTRVCARSTWAAAPAP